MTPQLAAAPDAPPTPGGGSPPEAGPARPASGAQAYSIAERLLDVHAQQAAAQTTALTEVSVLLRAAASASQQRDSETLAAIREQAAATQGAIREMGEQIGALADAQASTAAAVARLAAVEETREARRQAVEQAREQAEATAESMAQAAKAERSRAIWAILRDPRLIGGAMGGGGLLAAIAQWLWG